MWKKTTTLSASDLSPKHQKFIWEHHIWCHVKISELATLVSMIPNFWCSLEVAAAELHVCFVIKGNVWWKSTFLPMVTVVVLHHKHMKLFKPFTPHVFAWSVTGLPDWLYWRQILYIFGYFRGSWCQKNCLAFSFQYLAFLMAVGTYYQTGVFAFWISFWKVLLGFLRQCLVYLLKSHLATYKTIKLWHIIWQPIMPKVRVETL